VSAEYVRQVRDYEIQAAGPVRRDAGIRIWLVTMATLLLMTLIMWAMLSA